MKKFTCYIDAVGAALPRVDNWTALSDLLTCGDAASMGEIIAGLAHDGTRNVASWAPAAKSLSKREAKRLSLQTQIAIVVAEQIDAALPPESGWVFASSVGEGDTLNSILQALSNDDMMIQPLRFQNAVHNAAIGQWMIAAGRRGAATSIAAFDDTFAAGLLKAVLSLALDRRPSGLIAFDAPLPPPLHEKRPVAAPMSLGLALSLDRSETSVATLEVASTGGGDFGEVNSPFGKAMLATGNPIAKAASLLELLARRQAGELRFCVGGDAALSVRVVPS